MKNQCTMKNSILSIAIIFTIIGLSSCLVDQNSSPDNTYSAEEMNVISARLNLPSSPFSYEIGSRDEDISTNYKGTLGRVLFYDKNLSADASVSCASCHKQELAFSDDSAFSTGANGSFTARNSIALGAVRNFGMHYEESDLHDTPGLFWDERVATVKEQLRQTINNPNEMGVSIDHIINVIETQEDYQVLHQKAYNTTEVTEDHVLESIETFINSISAVNSKFDADIIHNLNFINGDMVTGTIDNELGLEVFSANCSSCHGKNISLLTPEAIENNINVANNGLELADNDLGVYQSTLRAEDKGKFKVPGLFNIELTAPYMHDGRFNTLEEVVEHYDSGVVYNENLSDALKVGNQAKRLNLSSEEKTALVKFLKSLTGEEITSNEIWSDPFK